MKRLLFLLITFAGYAYSWNRHDISILLCEGRESVLLEADGPFDVYDPFNKTHISSGYLAKRFLVHNEKSGIKWGEQFVGHRHIKIVPRSADTSILVDGIQYSGAISIYGRQDRIDVVNDVKIEDFVMSTLSTKCSDIVDSEVMSAVAILARTYAYFGLYNNTKSPLWQLDAKECSYSGCGTCVPKSLAQEVVRSTMGLALVQNQMFIPATWTENSAGMTASFGSIFRTYNFGSSVKTPLSAKSRQSTHWNFDISKKKLSKALGVAKITSLKPFVDKASKKVYALRLVHDGKIKDLSFFELQKAIGKNYIQSNDFVLKTKDDSITFDGYGIGSGVGVCLYEATELASDGIDAMGIIKAFYPKVTLINVYSNVRR